MSVWKKAAKANQKTHQERHQPEFRQHLGLLEKKKDYVKRAKDFNEKRDTLKVLQKRALNKNPDEFYHHMINSKVANGVHHEKDTRKSHTRDQLKLMQTQDIRYINLKKTQEMKRIERLQSQMHLIDVQDKPKNSHKFLFDSREEANEFLENRKKTRAEAEKYSLATLSDKPLANLDADSLEAITRKRESTYRELASRIKREKELSIVQQKLEIKKHLHNRKGSRPPRKIQDATQSAPPVYRWKSQRNK